MPGDDFDMVAPVPRIWRFHLIYVVVAGVMGLASRPLPVAVSLGLIALLAGLGIVLATVRRRLASHVLAVAIGLGTPLIFFARLGWAPAITVLAALAGGIYAGRRLFF